MSLTILTRSERLQHMLPESRELRITGFQSPAEDEKERGFSLDRIVGIGAPQMRAVMVNDDGLIGFGIYPGDRLIVERSVSPCAGNYVVAHLDGADSYCVRLVSTGDKNTLMLVDAQSATLPLTFEDPDCVEIWGVVMWVVSYVGRG